MDSSGVRNAAAGSGVGSTGPAGHSRRRFEVLEECRGLILERLTSVIAQALTRMSDELTAEALRSVRSDQQQALLDAVMLVRDNRMEIEGRFRRSFGDIFERRLFAMQGPAPDGAAPEAQGELELMSDDVIRDKLSVDRLIGRARSKLDPDQVLGMRARFGALLERDWFDESQHPASPEAVYEALKSALAELSPRHEVKVALLDAFEPHVSQNLNGIYAVVNDRLRAHHVLPKIKRQVQTSADTGARRTGPDVASGAPGAPGAAGPMQGGAAPAGVPGQAGAHEAWVAGSFGVIHPGMGGGGPAMPMHGHPGAGHGPMPPPGMYPPGAYPPGTYQGGPQGGMPGTHGAGSPGAMPVGDALFPMSPDDPLAALNHAMQEASAGRPNGRMHVARVLSNPAMFGVADIPVAAVRPPLVASLTALQRGPLPLDDASMLPQIVERVREQGSPLDQITVEIVSMVFDYIYADRRLPDQIKQQLLRLQVVAVKAALLDRSFFARRQHPMRRLLDRISEVGADPDADLAVGGALITALDATVARIIAEFDTDLGVFDAALASIDDIARLESERRTAEIEASSRAAALEEALAIAQEAARTELGRRIDKDSPAFVREFLHRWWTAVLSRARTAGDGSQDAWEAGLRTADYLVWSVAPKVSDDIPRLATVLPGLIRGLNHGLALVEIPPEARAAFFDELLRAHTLEIAAAKKRSQQAPSSRPSVTVRLQQDGTVRFTPSPSQQAVAVPAVSASDALLSPLKRGQLIELAGDDGPRLMKLAWISPARKLFILTRHPDESVTFAGGEFAFMLQRGQARVAADGSTLDRAIGSVTGDEAPVDAPDLALAEPA